MRLFTKEKPKTDPPPPAVPEARALAGFNRIAIEAGLPRETGRALMAHFHGDEAGASEYLADVVEACQREGKADKAAGYIAEGKELNAIRDDLRAARPKPRLPDNRLPAAPIASLANFDDPDALPPEAERFVDAMLAHAHPDYQRKHRDLPPLPPAEVARAVLIHSGISADYAPRDKVLATAMGTTRSVFASAGMHTTSDFPEILEVAANRSVNMGFDEYRPALLRVGRERRSEDFRPVRSVRISGGEELEPTNEAGEFKAGTLQEGAESFKLFTWGKIYKLTRQLMANDTDSLLTDQRRLGRGAALAVGKHLVTLLEANAGAGQSLSDGNPVFHTSRGNIAASGAAISVATLSEARTAMRRQVDDNGNPISPGPRYLIVPPELETLAQQVLADIEPTTTAEVNPFSGSLELLVEPLLSDETRWYLAADPATGDGLQYAYLSGSGGVETFVRDGWEIDGTEIKLRLDFGAGFIEGRTWWANDGA